MRQGDTLKFSDLKDKDVFVQDEKIGHIEDLYFDNENWKITDLEIRFTKDAGYEILGSKLPIRNMLKLSALKEAGKCCTFRGIEIAVTKAQLHQYLKPPIDK